jgi:20S proteasome alpha/beta subunit
MVRDFFKDQYKASIDLEGAVKLAVQGIIKATGEKTAIDPVEKSKTVEIGRIDTTSKMFRILGQDEVEAILKTI